MTGRDRSAEHAWNGGLGRTATASGGTGRPLADAEKLRAAAALASRARTADDLRTALAVIGLDLAELRRLRATHTTSPKGDA